MVNKYMRHTQQPCPLGKCNRNYINISPHSSQNGYHQEYKHLSIYLKECKSGYNRDAHRYTFTATLLTTASLRNSLDVLQLMSGLRKCGIFTQGMLFSHREE
jgi:hypothetical protein